MKGEFEVQAASGAEGCRFEPRRERFHFYPPAAPYFYPVVFIAKTTDALLGH
jgi:hypothetical protein